MKIMKKYIGLILVFSIAILSSCNKEEFASSVTKEFVFLDSSNTDLFFQRPGTDEQVSAGVRVVMHAQGKTSAVNYTYEVLPSSTAVEGTHYVINSNTGSIQPNTVVDTLPLSIIPDNLVSCQTLTLDVRLVSSDLPTTNMGTLSISLGVEGGSELAGTVNYEHTENFVGSDLLGTTEIIPTATPGNYMIEDFSFGAWTAAYGIDPPTGTLLWKNNCSSISLSGTDNYGDTWQMDEILASDGPVFTFTWSNTYGEFGKVSLTRQDGKPWPLLELE
jgi:hypothetical protein